MTEYSILWSFYDSLVTLVTYLVTVVENVVTCDKTQHYFFHDVYQRTNQLHKYLERACQLDP